MQTAYFAHRALTTRIPPPSSRSSFRAPAVVDPAVARLAKAAVAVYPVRGGLRSAVQPEFTADEVLFYRNDATLVLPAFAILVSAELCAVVVAVRGTASLSDGITDLAATQAHFLGRTAHAGMVACVHSMSEPAFVDSVAAALAAAGHLPGGFSAQAAAETEKHPVAQSAPAAPSAESIATAPSAALAPITAPKESADSSDSGADGGAATHNTAEIESDAFTALLQRLLADRPGYALAFTGHSLGAGVAAALCLQVRAQLFRRLCQQGDAEALKRLNAAAPNCGISVGAAAGKEDAPAVRAALHQLPDAAAVALCPLPVHAVCLATPAALSAQLAALGTLHPAEAWCFATAAHPPENAPAAASSGPAVAPAAASTLRASASAAGAVAGGSARPALTQPAAVAAVVHGVLRGDSPSAETTLALHTAAAASSGDSTPPAVGGAGAAPSPAAAVSMESASAPSLSLSPGFCRDWPIITSLVIGDDIVPTLTVPATREAVRQLQDPAHAAEGRKLVGRDWERASAEVASSFQLGMQIGAPELLRVHARATDALQGVLASAAGSPVVRDATAVLDRAAAAAKAAGSSIGSFFRGVFGTPPASPALGGAAVAVGASAPPPSPLMTSAAAPGPAAVVAESNERAVVSVTASAEDSASSGSGSIEDSPAIVAPSPAAAVSTPTKLRVSDAAVASSSAAAAEPTADIDHDGSGGATCVFEQRLATYRSLCSSCVVNDALQPLVIPGRVLHLVLGSAHPPANDGHDGHDGHGDALAGSEPSALSLADHGEDAVVGVAAGSADAPSAATLHVVPSTSGSSARRGSGADVAQIASRARAKAAAKAVLAEAEPDSWQGALMPESAEEVAGLVCAAVDAGRLTVEAVSPDTCARIIISPRAVKDHSHTLYLATIAAAAELRAVKTTSTSA